MTDNKKYPPLPAHKHRLNSGRFDPLYTADQLRAYVDADRAMRVASATKRQYYWWVSACPASSAKASNCICWHNEGTGPLADRPDYLISKWRDVPASPDVEEKKLRRMLCVAYSGAAAYMDDGEASDARAHPFIDFMRDSPDEIQAKMLERGIKAAPASQDAEDAARYRYLKKYKTWDSTDVFYWLRCAPADEVDSIIDAARSAQGESNEPV